MKKFSKHLAVLLAILMVVSILPFSAFAQGSNEPPLEETKVEGSEETKVEGPEETKTEVPEETKTEVPGETKTEETKKEVPLVPTEDELLHGASEDDTCAECGKPEAECICEDLLSGQDVTHYIYIFADAAAATAAADGGVDLATSPTVLHKLEVGADGPSSTQLANAANAVVGLAGEGEELKGWFAPGDIVYSIGSPISGESQKIFLYPQFGPQEGDEDLIDVHFWVNGTIAETKEVAKNSAVAKPADPALPAGAVNFRGWFTTANSGLEGEPYDFAKGVTEELNLHAVFSNHYLVKYKDGYGQVKYTFIYTKDAPVPGLSNAQLDSITSPNADEHFVYWYVDGDTTKTKVEFPFAAKADVTLAPCFSKEYMVLFISAGTQVEDNPQMVEAGKYAKEPTVEPTRLGYDFKHWSTEENGTVNYFATGRQPAVTADTYLHAVWTPRKVDYTVVFWYEVPNFGNDVDAEPTPGTPGHYSAVHSITKQANAGTTPNLSFSDSDIASVMRSDAYGLKYGEVRSITNPVISGTGTTVVNVYVDRAVYTIYFDLKQPADSSYSTGWLNKTWYDVTYDVSMKFVPDGAEHKGTDEKYAIRAKYEQNIAAQFPFIPTAEFSFTKTTTRRDDGVVTATETQYFRSWSAGWLSIRPTMDKAILDSHFDGGKKLTFTTEAVWTTSKTKLEGAYYAEALAHELADPTVTKYKLGNKWYVELTGLRQITYNEENNWTQKDLHGMTKLGNKKQTDFASGNRPEAGLQRYYVYDRVSSNLVFNTMAPTSEVAKVPNVSVKYEERLGSIANPNPQLTRTGYTFKGWYLDENFKNPVVWTAAQSTELGIPMTTMPADGLEIFALWESDEFTVTYYDLSERADPLGTQGYAKDDTVKYRTTFDGVTIDGVAIVYEVGASIPGKGEFLGWEWSVSGHLTMHRSETPVTKDFSLFAKWRTTGFIVKYDKGEGKEGSVVPVDGQAEYALNQRTRVKGDEGVNGLGSLIPPTGKVFYAWRSSVDGKLYYPGNLLVVAGDTVLTAQYLDEGDAKLIEYYANYPGGPTEPIRNTVPKNSFVTLPGDKAFDRSGWRITGWTTAAEPAETDTRYTPGSSNEYKTADDNETEILYAQWERVTSYDVTFKVYENGYLNGNAATKEVTFTVEAGNSLSDTPNFSLPVPSPDDNANFTYTGRGWYINFDEAEKAGAAWNPETGVTAPVYDDLEIVYTYDAVPSDVEVTFRYRGLDGNWVDTQPQVLAYGASGAGLTVPPVPTPTNQHYWTGAWEVNVAGYNNNPTANTAINTDLLFTATYGERTAITFTTNDIYKPYDKTALVPSDKGTAAYTINLPAGYELANVVYDPLSTVTNVGDAAVSSIASYDIVETNKTTPVNERFIVTENFVGEMYITPLSIVLKATDSKGNAFTNSPISVSGYTKTSGNFAGSESISAGLVAGATRTAPGTTAAIFSQTAAITLGKYTLTLGVDPLTEAQTLTGNPNYTITLLPGELEILTPNRSLTSFTIAGLVKEFPYNGEIQYNTANGLASSDTNPNYTYNLPEEKGFRLVSIDISGEASGRNVNLNAAVTSPTNQTTYPQAITLNDYQIDYYVEGEMDTPVDATEWFRIPTTTNGGITNGSLKIKAVELKIGVTLDVTSPIKNTDLTAVPGHTFTYTGLVADDNTVTAGQPDTGVLANPATIKWAPALAIPAVAGTYYAYAEGATAAHGNYIIKQGADDATLKTELIVNATGTLSYSANGVAATVPPMQTGYGITNTAEVETDADEVILFDADSNWKFLGWAYNHAAREEDNNIDFPVDVDGLETRAYTQADVENGIVLYAVWTYDFGPEIPPEKPGDPAMKFALGNNGGVYRGTTGYSAIETRNAPDADGVTVSFTDDFNQTAGGAINPVYPNVRRAGITDTAAPYNVSATWTASYTTQGGTIIPFSRTDTAQVTVTPLAVTVKADDYSIKRGDDFPTGYGSWAEKSTTPMAPGEGIADLGLTDPKNIAASQYNPAEPKVGKYGIVVKDQGNSWTNPNYTVSFENGTLTVTAAWQVVYNANIPQAAIDAGAVYDDSNIPNNTNYYAAGVSVPVDKATAKQPTWEGYTFLGWHLDNTNPKAPAFGAGSTTPMPNYGTDEDKVLTIYAAWAYNPGSLDPDYKITNHNAIYDDDDHQLEVLGLQAGDTVTYATTGDHHEELDADGNPIFSRIVPNGQTVTATVKSQYGIEALEPLVGTVTITPRNLFIAPANLQSTYTGLSQAGATTSAYVDLNGSDGLAAKQSIAFETALVPDPAIAGADNYQNVKLYEEAMGFVPGSIKITGTRGDVTKNYIPKTGLGDFEITKANLHLYASSHSIGYGDGLPAMGVAFRPDGGTTGNLLGKDSLLGIWSVLTASHRQNTFRLATAYNPASPQAGRHSIYFVDTFEADNYNVIRHNGTLTVGDPGAPPYIPPVDPPVDPPVIPPVDPPVDPPDDPEDPVEFEPEETPLAEFEPAEVLPEDEIPMANLGAWALLNLIIAILTLVFAVLLLVTAFKRNKEKDETEEEQQARMAAQAANGEEPDETERNKKSGMLWRVLSILAGIAAPIVFLLTENIRLPMQFTDRWTLLMVIILVVQVIGMLLMKRARNQEKDEDEEQPTEA